MGLNRRGFLKAFAGVSAGATVGMTFSPIPWKLTDEIAIWTQNWSWIPSLQYGKNSEVRVISKTCPSANALRVRLVDGRPVRVLPDETHPLGGGVTSLSAAEVQLLYSPSRVQKPMLKDEKGKFKEIEWEEAGQLLFDKVKEARKETAFITGDENGSITEVVSAFASALGTEKVFLMPSEAQAASNACSLMGLESVQLGYELENSDYVLAIGADILESWGTVTRNRRAFKNSRPHSVPDSAENAVFSYAGPVRNNTAGVAKPWLPIKPGTEFILALGIANRLIAEGRTISSSEFGTFAQLTARFSPEVVTKYTGLSEAALNDTVKALLEAKRPLVIVGGEFNQGGGAAQVVAGFLVNALLGNINKKGGVNLLPVPAPVLRGAVSKSDLYKNDLLAWIEKDVKPGVLILNEANPLYALPSQAKVKAFMKEIPFKAAFTSMMDETAAECDLVLPIPMGLERIDDVTNPYGCGKSIYALTLPVSAVDENKRSAADTLIFIGKQLGFDLGVENYAALLKKKAPHMGANYDVLAMGDPVENNFIYYPSSLRLPVDVLGSAVLPQEDQKALSLAVFSKLNMGTPTTGIPPFNVKTIRASELDAEDMFVSMNAATAKKKELSDGCRIKLKAGENVLTAKLKVFEGVVDDTVAVCTGYGHTAFDEFSQSKGSNVMELLTAIGEPQTALTVWNMTAVDVSKA